MSAAWEDIWPPFGLSLSLGPVEMHPVRFDDIPPLIDLLSAGIVADGVTLSPIGGDFGVGEYTPKKQRESLAFWCSRYGTSTPEKWQFPLAVSRDGELVGVQDFWADSFPKVRSITSGSWLGYAHQGTGTGTLMRQALAMFAFDHLDARELLSEAFASNEASNTVSRKVGYQPNGARLRGRGDGVEQLNVWRLTPETLNRPNLPLEVDGLDPFLELLGLAGQDEPA